MLRFAISVLDISAISNISHQYDELLWICSMIFYDKHPTENKNHTQDIFMSLEMTSEIESPASTFSQVSKRSHVSPIKEIGDCAQICHCEVYSKSPME